MPATSNPTSKRRVNAASLNLYLAASLAQNTQRAYRSDLQHFLDWGGTLPSTPYRVATYLASHATQLSCSTLSRRIVAIGRAHTAKGLPSPTQSDLVRATLRGIRRTRGRAVRQVAPLLKKDVFRLVKGLTGLSGLRDKALLLIGFAGALRRSELVALNVEDLQFVENGLVIRLQRSKTDQTGRGRDIAIPFVRSRYCPCRSLQAWLYAADIQSGALFRGINRYGQVRAERMTAQSVALIVKRCVLAAGLDATRYSGHSLRAGFATSAALAGASSLSIRAQTGHTSDEMLQRYVRSSQLFTDNPNRAVW